MVRSGAWHSECWLGDGEEWMDGGERIFKFYNGGDWVVCSLISKM